MRVEIPGTAGNKICVSFNQYNNRVVKCCIYDNNIRDYGFTQNITCTGTAKCHPDDTFDFNVGADMALQHALLKRENIYDKIERQMVQQIRRDSVTGGKVVYNKFKKKYKIKEQ